MELDWRAALRAELSRRPAPGPTADFPLAAQTFRADEIIAMTEVLLSGQLTMAERVRRFEDEFARALGVSHAVMVNSGSSANLLALAAAANPARADHLRPGDEVLVPAVCWSTSVWPIIQMGLRPVFVDVDPGTLNIDVADLKRKISPRARALVAVHVLGLCAPMDEVLEIARARHLMVIEDTCESLGSTWRGRALGTLGAFGTYSFYFSHHMTTGEGGMVVCHDAADYDLLKCLRAHGWTRELADRGSRERAHADVDPRFLFINVGYNVRPMEIQGALGSMQLARLKTMNEARVANARGLREALARHPGWAGQFEFPRPPAGAEPAWFGFPVMLSEEIKISRSAFLEELDRRGVENRPIVSGNFARQPALSLFGLHFKPSEFTGAERVHHRGFFVGLPSELLDALQIQNLAGRMLGALLDIPG